MCWYFQLVVAISFGQFFNTTECRDIVILFFASSGATSGLVRVHLNGLLPDSSRQTICWDNNWGMANANVTCRQMGFLKATSYQAKSSAVFNPVLHNVSCTGNETNICDCSYKYDHGGKCLGGKHVEVTCSENPAFDGLFDVRLFGNAANIGIVEVRVPFRDRSKNRLWFTQCYNLWSPINSEVVCKQLGYRRVK